MTLFAPSLCRLTEEIQRYSQLGEPRELKGSDGDLADAVSAQSQDLES